MTPEHTFKMQNGQEITFVQYYKNKHKVTLKDVKQPMLVVKSKLKDRHVGPGDTIYLVPELCRATGMSVDILQLLSLVFLLSIFLVMRCRSLFYPNSHRSE